MSTIKTLSIITLKRSIPNGQFRNIIILRPVYTKYIPIHFFKPYPNDEAWDDILQTTWGGVYEIHIDNWKNHLISNNLTDMLAGRNQVLSGFTNDNNYNMAIQDIRLFNYAYLMYVLGVTASKGEIVINNGNINLKYGLNIWNHSQNGIPQNNGAYLPTLAGYIAHIYCPSQQNPDTYFTSITIPHDTISFEITYIIAEIDNNIANIRTDKVFEGIITSSASELRTNVLHIIINNNIVNFYVTQPSIYKVNKNTKHVNKNILTPTAYGYTTEIRVKNYSTNRYVRLRGQMYYMYARGLNVFFDTEIT